MDWAEVGFFPFPLVWSPSGSGEATGAVLVLSRQRAPGQAAPCNILKKQGHFVAAAPRSR